MGPKDLFPTVVDFTQGEEVREESVQCLKSGIQAFIPGWISNNSVCQPPGFLYCKMEIIHHVWVLELNSSVFEIITPYPNPCKVT